MLFGKDAKGKGMTAELISTLDSITNKDRSKDTFQKLASLCSAGFEYLDEFYEGGEAFSLKVRNLYMERNEMLKVPKRVIIENAKKKERFFRGMSFQSKLHKYLIFGIPEIYRAEWVIPHVSMEYIKGLTLLKYLDRCSYEDGVLMMLKMLNICEEMHNRGIIHRDIKPDNWLISKNPITEEIEPVLIDFGLAKSVDHSPALTGIGAEMGTKLWSSPEQLDDAARANFLDDVYSLGRVLFTILTYKQYGVPTTEKDYDERHLDGEYVNIFSRAVGPRETRYKSVTEFKNDLMHAFGVFEVAVHQEDIVESVVEKAPESNDNQERIDYLVRLFIQAARSSAFYQPNKKTLKYQSRGKKL